MKRAAALAVPLAAVALVAVVCAQHARNLGEALDRVDPWIFVAAVALHLAVLVVRTEAWRITLAATGRVPPRRAAHSASAIGFVAGIVEGHAALPARMAVARRLAPTETPPLREMLLSDLPVYAIEACLLAMLVPLAAAHGIGLPPWSAGLALVAPPAGVLGLRLLHQRFESHRLAAGLAVLGKPGLRGRLLVATTIVVGLTFVRVWITLAAVGLPAGPDDAAVAYVAVTLVGQLPLGPATGPAATLAIASGSGVAEAAAAGLVIGAASIAGVLLYLVVTAAIRPRTRSAA
jgi:Lysylphosphatidylglycerol synthase TM region